MSNQDLTLRYDIMVENALRSVVKTTLKEVEKKGLSGEHHFFITFRTKFPGVMIPDYLRDEYSGEMTIVLQYEFYDLEVLEDKFSVTLSFDDIHERLEIPYQAITTFADPSVNFALQFQPIGEVDGEDIDYELEDIAEEIFEKNQQAAASSAQGQEMTGQVVALDAFRKKKQGK